MSRRLDDLSPRMRPLAIELIARCIEAGILVLIVDTLRTPQEQAAYLEQGVSWTQNSKHLTGDAIDLAPYEIWMQYGPDKINWDHENPAWARMGHIGERVGLRWGGRWRQRDMGHFEYLPPSEPPRLRLAE